MLLFGVYFPERSRIDARAPWLKWMILGPLAACIVILLAAIYADYYTGGDGPLLTKVGNDAARVLNFLNLLCVIFYLVLTVDKLRSASTEDARRRLRVLAAGTGVGVGALLIVFILLPHFGINGSGPQALLDSLSGRVLFMIAPLTLAYVVLVQRAMDVRVILRMGTRYLMAKAFSSFCK